jgi:hypothetical protein
MTSHHRMQSSAPTADILLLNSVKSSRSTVHYKTCKAMAQITIDIRGGIAVLQMHEHPHADDVPGIPTFHSGPTK